MKQNTLGNTSILENTLSTHNGPRKKKKKSENTNTVVISEDHTDVSALHFLVTWPQAD